eukprot:scaffold30271_cov217-Amphora_coffeaeformis.AAC.2
MTASSMAISSSCSSSSCLMMSKWLLLRTRQNPQRSAASSASRMRWRSFGSSSSSTAASAATATAAPQLYMWGTDTKGSLLRNTALQNVTKVDVPTRIEPHADDGSFLFTADESSTSSTTTTTAVIQQVVCGATDTAVILTDGSCFVWGENKLGQLGVGHNQPVSQPTRVTLPAGDDNEPRRVAQVSLGQQMGAFVDTVGDLYTCGFGGSVMSGFGLLGHGDAMTDGDGAAVQTPKLVESLVEDGCFVKQVAVGESHMTCLTTEGEVLTTGSGSYGRLGNFDTKDQLYFEPVEILTTGVTAIAAGKSFTLALASDGVLYGWGRNHKGQLGTGLGLAADMYAMQAIPEPIETDELLGRRVVKVAAGAGHAACITQGGELFYWGMSLHLEPVRVTELLHTKVVDVACGLDYTLVLDEEGRMYSFGKGSTGVLGQGSVKNLNQPALMEVFEGKKVLQASAGWKHAACLVEDA